MGEAASGRHKKASFIRSGELISRSNGETGVCVSQDQVEFSLSVNKLLNLNFSLILRHYVSVNKMDTIEDHSVVWWSLEMRDLVVGFFISEKNVQMLNS